MLKSVGKWIPIFNMARALDGKKISRWLAIKTFSTKDRIDLYEDISFLLENNLKMEDALVSMIESQKNKQSAQCCCLQDMLTALKKGSSPDRGLIGWIPVQEMVLIQAGNQDGNFAQSFKRAMTIAQANAEMRSACFSALSYPTLLCFSSLIMMYMVDTRFLPRLATMVPESEWTGALWWLSVISDGIIKNILLIGLILFCTIIGINISLDNLTGTIRSKFLDRLLPWSVYRDVQGVAFLLNFTSLMKAQIKTYDALMMLSRHASPWLFERLTATIMQIKQGKQIGQAFRDSGYRFPSPRSIDRLVLLTRGDRNENIIENFAYHWLKQTISKIKKIASLLSYIALSMNALYMVLILLSTQDLNNLISVR